MFQLERRKLWSSGMLGAGIPWEHSLRILLTVYPSWSRRFTSLPPRRTLPYRRVSKAAPSPLADLSLREMKVSNCFMFLHRCPEKAGGGLSGLGGCNFDRGESNTLVGDIGVSFSLSVEHCRGRRKTTKRLLRSVRSRHSPDISHLWEATIQASTCPSSLIFWPTRSPTMAPCDAVAPLLQGLPTPGDLRSGCRRLLLSWAKWRSAARLPARSRPCGGSRRDPLRWKPGVGTASRTSSVGLTRSRLPRGPPPGRWSAEVTYHDRRFSPLYE